MLRFRDLRIQDKTEESPGIIASRKGRKMLPDLPTAILAKIRGYVGGSYPTPLTGDAAKIGYHSLSSASEEELEQIQNEMQEIMSKAGGDDGWNGY